MKRSVGADWLDALVADMPEDYGRQDPVSFNESTRYLPEGVSPRPGYIRYDLFPFLREPLQCFDPRSDVREVNFMKGVQVGYTTLLESVMLYYIAHVQTQALFFMTADKDLAKVRVENNILPMIAQSGLGHLVQTADEGNARKTGKTSQHIQWKGGGSLVYYGANNPSKMRSHSAPVLLKDELDGWPYSAGGEGDTDSLTDARATSFWTVRKILRGSTPLVEPSLMHAAYLRGDQREYRILCKHCGHPHKMKFQTTDKETGVVGGFVWKMDGDTLDIDSVEYLCPKCGGPHTEEDKERLFSEDFGAHWHPTAKPVERGIRSYHLPAFYSPYNFRPWYKCVSDYLEAFNPDTKAARNVTKMQVFYNNTLGVPFRPPGEKVPLDAVRAQKRPYGKGTIPNIYAEAHSGSKILFTTCQVDVHKRFLAVALTGWAKDCRCYLLDYYRIDIGTGDDCSEVTSDVWRKLAEDLDRKTEGDDETKYRPVLTFIDSGYSNATVVSFCSGYGGGVHPILGRERVGTSSVREFSEYKTRDGTVGYMILVDHYKDRIASVLKRVWNEEHPQQPEYHISLPSDLPEEDMKELIAETRVAHETARGRTQYKWVRPQGARNELFDLIVYGSAAVEVLAWSVCIQHFELTTVDWADFWVFAASPQNAEIFGRFDT